MTFRKYWTGEKTLSKKKKKARFRKKNTTHITYSYKRVHTHTHTQDTEAQRRERRKLWSQEEGTRGNNAGHVLSTLGKQRQPNKLKASLGYLRTCLKSGEWAGGVARLAEGFLVHKRSVHTYNPSTRRRKHKEFLTILNHTVSLRSQTAETLWVLLGNMHRESRRQIIWEKGEMWIRWRVWEHYTATPIL